MACFSLKHEAINDHECEESVVLNSDESTVPMAYFLNERVQSIYYFKLKIENWIFLFWNICGNKINKMSANLPAEVAFVSKCAERI